MSDYCQANGNACPCGKFGMDILRCKKPFTDEQVAECLREIGERVEMLERHQVGRKN